MNHPLNVALSGEIFVWQKYGGVSRYFLELAVGLQELGLAQVKIEADFFVNAYLMRTRKTLKHDGIYVKQAFRGLRQISLVTNSFRRVINKARPEIVHCSYYAFERLRFVSYGKVSTFYDMIERRCQSTPSFVTRQARTYELSDHCIAISEATKSDMVHYLGADPDRISVVYLASDLRTDGDFTVGKPRQKFFLWVGPRAGYKNFDLFVRGFSTSRAFREGCKIVCAGGPPINSSEKQFFGQLGLSSQSVSQVFPDDSELIVLYSQAEALVYTSHYEGFGIPPLEAMQCKCPVIAANGGALTEVVGNAALIVDSRDVDDISGALDKILFDSNLRVDLISRGIRQASQFSWHRCARETFEVYERVLAARS